MESKTNELESLITDWYVPSASERKKAVLMYFLLWILISVGWKKLSVYESFHLKQAIWVWGVFIVCFVSSLFLFFIPFVKIIPVFLFLVMLIVFVIFIKQAWDWVYTVDSDKMLLPFFYGIWGWVLDVFDVDVLNKNSDIKEKSE